MLKIQKRVFLKDLATSGLHWGAMFSGTPASCSIGRPNGIVGGGRSGRRRSRVRGRSSSSVQSWTEELSDSRRGGARARAH